ncbi:MAG: hypothetical protein ACMUIG_10200 [Thermoplasmatota archaeon]
MRKKKGSMSDHPPEEILERPYPDHDDAEDICDILEGSPVGQRHVLVRDDGDYGHIWLAGDSLRIPVTDLKAAEISGLMAFFADQLTTRSDHPTNEGALLRFQSFGSHIKGFPGLEIDDSTIAVVREDDLINIRMDSKDNRYTIIFDTRPSNSKMGSYAVSRLRSRGCVNVPDLMGISYWDRSSGPLIWSSMVRYDRDSHPSFRPFLQDLDDILKSILNSGPEGYHDYILELSKDRKRKSLRLSRELGRSLGNIHGNLIVGRREESPKASGVLGERISKIMSMGIFDMEDVGSMLGMVSSFLNFIKRGLRTNVGVVSSKSEPGSRKLKVVKRRSVSADPGAVISIPLRILSRGFMARESRIKNRFSGMREFRGSPCITSLLDSRLEKVMITGGVFVFDRFNWFPEGFEDETVMMLPLKDIAMTLNSLMKNRYLSARKVLRDLAGNFKVDLSNLESMYIDYNLSKRNYDNMRRDLMVSRFLSDRDSPFGSILAISVASALWYDRCRNEIVNGYTEGVEATGRDELLEYPPGANTLEAIDLLQIFVSLSELSKNIGPTAGPQSTAGIESALLTVLTR